MANVGSIIPRWAEIFSNTAESNDYYCLGILAWGKDMPVASGDLAPRISISLWQHFIVDHGDGSDMFFTAATYSAGVGNGRQVAIL
jgi:hypothetical protein